YKNLQQRSPKLMVQLNAPYLGGTAFGADVEFEYYKNDLNFRKVNGKFGLMYALNGNDHLSVFYQTTSNRITEIDTAFVRQNKQLPQDVDVRSSGGGMALKFNRTDYTLNPRRGWQLQTSAGVLRRKILPNNAVLGLSDAQFDYSVLYDSVRSDFYLVNWTWGLSKYTRLGKLFTLKNSYQGGCLLGPKDLFRNEMFQIGGFK